ncbi:hypothetical protein C8R47DRAFT_1014431 [Mycena vitilis]|nr:hypothetical protein C8R47DRAFT_1014431 [Mycena vitilis]
MIDISVWAPCSRSMSPSFISLYRLALRTTSASVSHQNRVTKSLRKLWRPAFEDAARTTTQLQGSSLSTAHRTDLEVWLQIWHHRMDNTLALLYTSSKTRGLSHRLTRNLALLISGEQIRINRPKLPQWKPRLPSGAEEYQPFFEDPNIAAARKRDKEVGFAWNALEEVVRMAESRNELSLGKITLKRAFRGDTTHK